MQSKQEITKFGLALAAVIVVLWIVILGFWNWGWLLTVAAIVVLVSLTAPAALWPVHWVLTNVGQALSKVLNPVLLGCVYFVIITPMGLTMRRFGHDPMRRKWDHEAISYREECDGSATGRFDRPF